MLVVAARFVFPAQGMQGGSLSSSSLQRLTPVQFVCCCAHEKLHSVCRVADVCADGLWYLQFFQLYSNTAAQSKSLVRPAQGMGCVDEESTAYFKQGFSRKNGYLVRRDEGMCTGRHCLGR